MNQNGFKGGVIKEYKGSDREIDIPEEIHGKAIRDWKRIGIIGLGTSRRSKQLELCCNYSSSK